MAFPLLFRALRRALFGACLVAGAMGLLAGSASQASSPAEARSSTVVQLQIDGEIEPVLAGYIVDGIHQAALEHASLILITINTPGGLDTSMREIIQAILESPVPVVNYVYPTGSRAASAGFFILLSADVDAMAPGTDTGAASPVTEIGGQTVEVDETLRKKILNEATAYLRSYVAKRGRNADLAATAVTDAKAFTEQEAIAGKLVDLEANSIPDLLAKLNGRTITRFDGSTTELALSNPAMQSVEMTGREKFLARIVQPDVFFILLIVGVLGLYTEFTHPGMFAPGVIGGIALVLALYAMLSLPVSLMGLLLISLALAFFVLEAKYPTHGVLGIGGVISMVLGALMLVKSPWTGMGVSLSAALGVAIPFAVIVIVLARFVLRSRAWKLSTGKEELIGEEGEVTEPVPSSIDGAPGPGMVRVHGELWRAAAPAGQSIPKGARVRVRKVTGLTLEVEPVGARQSAST
ncbi:MAG TPA: nodulation protein NfeD [Candidatus Acidoferrales bacterium]|jgi:membrane-bound serine protease (ClpP class)|nr:nodulation protein NfeD [Candidatus Acidoferrales bacterium]